MLLFVLIPGVGRASNHPELFGTTKPDDGESVAEQARGERRGQAARACRTSGYSTPARPDTGICGSSRSASGSTATPPTPARRSRSRASTTPRRWSRIRSSWPGALGLVLAMLAAYLIGTRMTGADPPLGGGRRPDRRRRPDARGSSCRAGASGELQVLAEAFNHMLDRLATAFAAQREFVADASHELRTPLTVLRGQLDCLAGGDRDDGSLVRSRARARRASDAV